MHAHRIETLINEDNSLILKDLPFQPGESVEIIILQKKQVEISNNAYPLHGKPIEYLEPTEPVAEQAWNIQQ